MGINKELSHLEHLLNAFLALLPPSQTICGKEPVLLFPIHF